MDQFASKPSNIQLTIVLLLNVTYFNRL